MADLIDRDALLKDLRSECPESDVCLSCSPCIECIVNRQSAVNRWIPCSERLPEKNVEVLAYSPYWGKIVVAMWGGEFWLEQWTDDDLEKSEISHWMPMPEPPKGGAEDG